MATLRMSTHAGGRVSSIRMLSPVKKMPAIVLGTGLMPISKVMVDLFPKKDVIAYITKMDISLNVINKDGKLLSKQEDPDVDALMLRLSPWRIAISFMIYDEKKTRMPPDIKKD
jgi:hypothetical protein